MLTGEHSGGEPGGQQREHGGPGGNPGKRRCGSARVIDSNGVGRDRSQDIFWRG